MDSWIYFWSPQWIFLMCWVPQYGCNQCKRRNSQVIFVVSTHPGSISGKSAILLLGFLALNSINVFLSLPHNDEHIQFDWKGWCQIMFLFIDIKVLSVSMLPSCFHSFIAYWNPVRVSVALMLLWFYSILKTQVGMISLFLRISLCFSFSLLPFPPSQPADPISWLHKQAPAAVYNQPPAGPSSYLQPAGPSSCLQPASSCGVPAASSSGSRKTACAWLSGVRPEKTWIFFQKKRCEIHLCLRKHTQISMSFYLSLSLSVSLSW